jgi:hypothetical protein
MAALRSYGYLGRDWQRNEGIVQRQPQGCVEASLSPRDPYFALSDLKATLPNPLR